MRQVVLTGIVALAAMSSFAQTTSSLNALKTTATITIDGNLNESAWQVTNNVTKAIVGTPNNTARFGVLWNSQYLYIAYTVTDASKYNDSPNEWDDDAVELYIDADNNGGTSYGTNDRQFMKGWNTTAVWEKGGRTTGVLHAWTNTATGYAVELAIPWSNIAISNPVAGRIIGFDIANDDDDNGSTRESQLMWAGDNNNWQYPRNFGDLVLVDAPDTLAPSAPSNLAAGSITQTTLLLTWTASTDNVAVTGYDVYRDDTKVNTSLVTTPGYGISGLTPGTTYSFYVVARDAAGNTSANSATIDATTISPDTEAPTAPADLVASGITFSSFVLNWTASTDNFAVTGYDVYVNNTKVNNTNITGTSFTVTGLSELTTYSVYVRANDQAGNFSNSDAIDVTTPEEPDTQAPTAPISVAASAITENSLTLTWNASTDNVGVTGYDIYQDATKINSSPVTALTYGVTGLSGATSYSFYVRAFDAAGNVSSNSVTVNAGTLDVVPPSAPANLSASAVAATTLTLSWTAATDNAAVTGYDIYRNSVKINSSPVTATIYSVTGLTASTAYSFYVTAFDAAGNVSANSNTINVTTTAGGCSGTGTINYRRYTNITGTAVTNLTSSASYPNSPAYSGTLTSFETPTNVGDNIGSRVYGYICPPATGSYTFWIASDDNAELWLSTTSSSANRVRIAYHTQWTNSREWNKYATQKSAAITLTAGQLYFVEALSKDGTQGDNLAVGWAKPGQSTTAPSEVIPGLYLLPSIPVAPDSVPPSAPASLSATNIAQTSCTLNWSAATDNTGIAGYDVYRNGTKINATIITSLSYNVTGLTGNTTYSFTVKAKDLAGNESASSAEVSVTTLAANPGSETFTQRTVIANQRMPHDLVYGPDNNLWYTERFAGRVSFVNPATGAKTVVLSLGSKMARSSGQDGLMGLALHPDFLTGKPYVYISYTYEVTSANVRKTRIERYTYSGGSLGSPVTILENIPGSNDHNSARLAIGPDLRLYYSVGDMGAGQFENQSRTNNAQNLNVHEGKVLRLNTESVAGSWIPTDNPFLNGGQPTAIYSYGHRNPQGLVWGNVNGTDMLYSSEHGPYSDDEINLIQSGRNYGWPNVIGFCDGNYNGRTTGGYAMGNEQTNCAALNVKEPLRSIFPSANPPQEGSDNMGWPSMAPSGMDFYGSTAIPNWQNSLLVAMLKSGTITRFKLSNDGQSIISDTINYFRGKGRFRDVVVSPDGLKIYVACDSSGSTSGPTGGVTSTPANAGSILEFTYVQSMGRGYFVSEQLPVEEDTKDRSIDVYPNPASTYVIVYNYGNVAGRTIELLDMNGKLVKKQSVSNLATRIETSGFANGFYILRVTDGKGKTIRTEKVIIQK